MDPNDESAVSKINFLNIRLEELKVGSIICLLLLSTRDRAYCCHGFVPDSGYVMGLI